MIHCHKSQLSSHILSPNNKWINISIIQIILNCANFYVAFKIKPKKNGKMTEHTFTKMKIIDKLSN